MKKRYLFSSMAIAACLLFAACSVDVQKHANGKEKTVEIDTPIANLRVNKDVNASDTGLPAYPGSRRMDDALDGNEKGAAVSFLTGIFGLKVVAVKYETNDSVDQVKDFYRTQLQKYGNLLECRANTIAINPGVGDSESNHLTCEQHSGNNIELKAGTPHNQYAVAIEPLAKGCKYSLVYLQVHDKGETI